MDHIWIENAIHYLSFYEVFSLKFVSKYYKALVESRIELIRKIHFKFPDSGNEIQDLFLTMKHENFLADKVQIEKISKNPLTSLWLERFCEKKVVARVKEMAKTKGNEVSLWIQKYGIQDKNELIEIAKIIALNNGAAISENIKNFGIEDLSALKEIALLAAQQNGKQTSILIKNYGIQDKGSLKEIAEAALNQNRTEVLLHLRNYGLKLQKGNLVSLIPRLKPYEHFHG